MSFEPPPAVHLALLAMTARLPFAQGGKPAHSARSSPGRRTENTRKNGRKSTFWSWRRPASRP